MKLMLWAACDQSSRGGARVAGDAGARSAARAGHRDAQGTIAMKLIFLI